MSCKCHHLLKNVQKMYLSKVIHGKNEYELFELKNRKTEMNR